MSRFVRPSKYRYSSFSGVHAAVTLAGTLSRCNVSVRAGGWGWFDVESFDIRHFATNVISRPDTSLAPLPRGISAMTISESPTMLGTAILSRPTLWVSTAIHYSIQSITAQPSKPGPLCPCLETKPLPICVAVYFCELAVLWWRCICCHPTRYCWWV